VAAPGDAGRPRFVVGGGVKLGYLRGVKISYHVMSAPAPIGLLFMARTERGLRYLEFLDRKSIKKVIASHAAENPGAEWVASLLDLKPITEALESYFHGSLRRFSLPLDPVGTEFQLTVWQALTEIPYAATRSYGDVAKSVAQPRAARAVGLANNQNPLVIVVPCHRVIGADGSLTGYGGGMPRKRWLLDHEAKFAKAHVLPGEITETLHTPKPVDQLELVLSARSAKPAAVAVRVARPATRADKPLARTALVARATARATSSTRSSSSRNGRSKALTATSARTRPAVKRSAGTTRARTAARPRAAASARSTRANPSRRG
jgi:methylated-DNA-[protein]-cysteine S-methyltransferase